MPLIAKSFSNLIAFTRASTATYFAANGVLTSAANNEPRFDYDPTTYLGRGILIEESRTNSIRNNTMQGAVAGTPGTAPTNWNTAGAGTLVQEIVGTGTDAGITYVDYRLSGTTSTTAFALLFDATTQIVAASGQAWTSSYYIKLQNGSATNITGFSNQVRGYNGGVLQESNNGTITLTSSLARSTHTFTLANASTTRVINNLLISFASGVAIDITLRIGLPQLELGAFATSVIPTTTTALTRSADVASVNTLSPWYNATEGTLYAEIMLPSLPPTGAFPAYADINNGTTNERIALSSNQFANHRVTVRNTAGVIFDTNAGGTIVANVPSKWAIAVKSGDFASAYNGAAGAVSSATGMPAGLTTLRIGSAAGVNQANGYIRRIVYYPRRLANADLQAITA